MNLVLTVVTLDSFGSGVGHMGGERDYQRDLSAFKKGAVPMSVTQIIG
jgi:hypothetical protein